MAKEKRFTVDINLSNIPEWHYDAIIDDITEQIYEVMQDYNTHIYIKVGVGEQEEE